MIEKTSTKAWLLMAVLIPYLILIGYSIAVYPDLPEKLENGLPRAIIFVPSLIVAILPATYAIMIFFFSEHLKKSHLLTIAAFMDIGIIAMTGAIYLIKDAN